MGDRVVDVVDVHAERISAVAVDMKHELRTVGNEGASEAGQFWALGELFDEAVRNFLKKERIV